MKAVKCFKGLHFWASPWFGNAQCEQLRPTYLHSLPATAPSVSLFALAIICRIVVVGNEESLKTPAALAVSLGIETQPQDTAFCI